MHPAQSDPGSASAGQPATRAAGVDEHIPDRKPTPVEEAIGSETLERYERSLTELKPEQREAVILRVEMGYTYEEMAEALARPSANAARMLVTRALVRLARGMLEAG